MSGNGNNTEKIRYFMSVLKEMRNQDLLSEFPELESTIAQEDIKRGIDMLLHNEEILLGILNNINATNPYKQPRKINPRMPPFIITVDHDGNYNVTFLFKSKRYDYTKRIGNTIRGTWKVRKVALTLGTIKPEVTVELIADVTGNPSLKESLQREISTQMHFASISVDVAKVRFAGVYIKQYLRKMSDISGKLIEVPEQREKLIITAPYRSVALPFLLSSIPESWMRINSPIQLTAEKLFHLEKAFNAVEVMHKERKAHRDLKFENLLMRPEGAQITDFGAVEDFGVPDHLTGMTDFSPWHLQLMLKGKTIDIIEQDIARALSLLEHIDRLPIQAQNKVQTLIRIRTSYAWHVLKAKMRSAGETVISPPKDYVVDGKHDVWCLALMTYDSIYGRTFDFDLMERNVAVNPLLARIFQPEAKDVPDITTAKQMFIEFAQGVYDEAKKENYIVGQNHPTIVPVVSGQNLWLGNIEEVFAKFNAATQVQKEDMLNLLLDLGPPDDYIKMHLMVDESEGEDESDNWDLDQEDILNLSKAPKKDLDLTGMFLNFDDRLHKITQRYSDPNIKTSEAEWLEYIKYKLMLQIAMYLILRVMQNQVATSTKGKREILVKELHELKYDVTISQLLSSIKKMQAVLKAEQTPGKGYKHRFEV